jgi:hypothetical protein
MERLMFWLRLFKVTGLVFIQYVIGMSLDHNKAAVLHMPQLSQVFSVYRALFPHAYMIHEVFSISNLSAYEICRSK